VAHSTTVSLVLGSGGVIATHLATLKGVAAAQPRLPRKSSQPPSPASPLFEFSAGIYALKSLSTRMVSCLNPANAENASRGLG
jgi:hypothetical protein